MAPDFLAGMIYGFTGDNELPEIEACYTGGEEIISDSQKLLDELKAEDWVQATKTGFRLNNEVQHALDTCQNLDGDIARIEAWGEIFTDPVRLSETVTKNWFLHRWGINKAQDQLNEDWAACDFFGSGIDTADILVLLVGPVP